MQMAAAANLPATNSFIQLEIYRAPFPLYVGTVLQENAENPGWEPTENTTNHRETPGNRQMIRGKYRERCLFAEEVINDKNKDTNHRKTATINQKKSTITGK